MGISFYKTFFWLSKRFFFPSWKTLVDTFFVFILSIWYFLTYFPRNVFILTYNFRIWFLNMMFSSWLIAPTTISRFMHIFYVTQLKTFLVKKPICEEKASKSFLNKVNVGSSGISHFCWASWVKPSTVACSKDVLSWSSVSLSVLWLKPHRGAIFSMVNSINSNCSENTFFEAVVLICLIYLHLTCSLVVPFCIRFSVLFFWDTQSRGWEGWFPTL